jgi:hypothetical protein
VSVSVSAAPGGGIMGEPLAAALPPFLDPFVVDLAFFLPPAEHRPQATVRCLSLTSSWGLRACVGSRSDSKPRHSKPRF